MCCDDGLNFTYSKENELRTQENTKAEKSLVKLGMNGQEFIIAIVEWLPAKTKNKNLAGEISFPDGKS